MPKKVADPKVGAHTVTIYWSNDPYTIGITVYQDPPPPTPYNETENPATVFTQEFYYNLTQSTFLSLNSGRGYTFTVIDHFNKAPNTQLAFPVKTQGPAFQGIVAIGSILSERKKLSEVFDILLPNLTVLRHYIWPVGGSTDTPLQLQDQLPLPTGSVVQDTAISLIQSWQTPNALEALARITTGNGNDTLIAFQFIPGSNRPTSFPVESDGVIDRVTGSPALIQDDQDLFNLLVPRASGLFHYTHTNQTLAGPWELKRQLTVPQGLSVVSLGFAQTDGVGGMVAVARVQEAANVQNVANAPEAVNLAGPSNTNFLVSYTYVADKGWQEPMIVELGNALVIGTPALIASNTSEGQERLELLVPTTEGLKHLINTPDAPANTWQLVTVLEALKDNRVITPVLASLVQTEPGKLQAFVREETSDGQFLLITYSYSRATGWSGPAKLQVPDAPNGGGGDGDGDGHGHGGGEGDGHGGR